MFLPLFNALIRNLYMYARISYQRGETILGKWACRAVWNKRYQTTSSPADLSPDAPTWALLGHLDCLPTPHDPTPRPQPLQQLVVDARVPRRARAAVLTAKCRDSGPCTSRTTSPLQWIIQISLNGSWAWLGLKRSPISDWTTSSQSCWKATKTVTKRTTTLSTLRWAISWTMRRWVNWQKCFRRSKHQCGS